MTPSKINGLLIDMDGVLWKGSTLLEGFHQFFDFLNSSSFPFVLLTNNSTRTVEQYLEKFSTVGIILKRNQIMTSAIATARFLEQEGYESVYVVGEAGVHEAALSKGITITEIDGKVPDAVVIGLDNHVTYEKLKWASLCVQKGSRFIATNGDLSFPSEKGLLPGAGSLVQVVSVTTGVIPKTMGKPEIGIFEQAGAQVGCKPKHLLMVGDRLDTDIKGASSFRCLSALIETGIHSSRDCNNFKDQPDYIFKNLSELIKFLRQQG